MPQVPPIPPNPGDVIVTGQRRPAGSPGPFPERPVPTVPQGEFDEKEPLGELPDPCAYPDTRKIWNADARAAAAVADLAAKAASLNDGSSLSNREFGANLFLGSGDSIELTEVTAGPATGGKVVIEPYGTTAADWMGDIHNHPGGDGRLSDGEWVNFINRISTFTANQPQRTELGAVSVYVVVLDASASHGYRIYAYTKDTPYNELGDEVNPDALPCS